MKRAFSLLIIGLLLSSSVFSQEHKKLPTGEPVAINSTVGKEKIIKFPEPVRRSVSQADSAHFIGSLIESSFYFTPRKKFNQRMLFQGIDSGRMYVIDLVASEQQSPNTTTLHLTERENESEASKSDSKAKVISAVDLVQYAAQMLYAPDLSLVEGVPSIKEVSLMQEPVRSSFYFGGRFIARPFRSWTAAGMYVTAVEFQNNTSTAQRWSICDVDGKFTHAAPHSSIENPLVGVSGGVMVYMISEMPFRSATSQRGKACLN